MSEAPVLKRLLICRDRSLPFLDLDLTDPETGVPLPELCLVGPNGCGKSDLLARLHEAITGIPRWFESGQAYYLARFAFEEEDLYLARPFGGEEGHLFRTSIESSAPWPKLASEAPEFDDLCDVFSEDLVLGSVPGLGAGSSLWFDAQRSFIDGESAGDLAAFVERRLQERQESFHRFLRAPENRDKTVSEVDREFESCSPLALPLLREVWNRLLGPSGLRVDFASEEGPFFNIVGRTFPVDRLGTALTNTLLRTGLAATRESSCLFLDGPEDGLHPALAQDLIPLFRFLGGSTPPRLFVSTQDPLVASRFAPANRLRLVVAGDGKISLARGIAPAGAGVEEILRSDFGLAESPPPAKEAPTVPESSRLQRAIRESEDEDELADLIDEVISIRRI